MRKAVSSYLKAKRIKNRLIIVILLIAFFVFIHGIVIYSINPPGSYFAFIKKIIPFPAIVIDKDIVTIADYERELSLIKSLYENIYRVSFEGEEGKAIFKEVKNNVKNELINRIIMDRILTGINMEVSNKEVSQEYEKIVKDLGGREEARNILKFASNWEENDLRKRIYYDLLKQKIKDYLIYHVKIKIVYIVPEKTNSQESWEEAKKETEDIYNRLIAGDITFDEAEREFNRNNSLIQNSDQKYYYLDELPESFADAISTLDIGEISNIVETESGYYLIKLEDRKGYYKGSLENFLEEQRKQLRIWIFID